MLVVFPSQFNHFLCGAVSNTGKTFSPALNDVKKCQTVNSVSADYDKVAGFFEDLDLYLSRLKILEGRIPLIPQLELALVEVLTSVFILCGICAKYMKMKRIGAAMSLKVGIPTSGRTLIVSSESFSELDVR